MAETCACGWGLSALPFFIARRYPQLRRLDGEVPNPTLWLMVHPELRRSARVRVVLDFVTETVDANRSLFQSL